MNRRSKMKKLIVALLMVGSSTAMAYDGYMGEILGGVAGGLLGSQIGGGNGRIAAAAIGAGIGSIVGGRVEDNMNYNRYGYGNNGYPRGIYQQPQVIYQQPQTVYQTQTCTAWVETIDRYGVATRTRTCY